MEYFWMTAGKIEELGIDGIGFKLFGKDHILWLLIITLLIFAATIKYQNSNRRDKARAKRIMAIAIAIAEIAKDVFIIVTGESLINYLPLHLCSFAIFAMLVDAFNDNQNITGQMMAYVFMPGALSALLFCSWTAAPAFANAMNIFSFLFHGAIICYFTMQFLSGEIRPTYEGIWTTIGIIALVSIPIYFLDIKTGLNYMYLNKPSEGSPLVFIWNMFGEKFGHAGYLMGYLLLVIAVLNILYLIYRFFSPKKSR